MPTNFVYGAFYFLVARLYVNSMLATLNARQTLSGNNITDVDMSRLRSGGPSNNSQTLNLSSSKFSSASEMRFKAAKNPEVTIGQPSFDETHGQEESYGKVDTRWQEATGISRV
ncbi:hypothetical protein PHLCEN_2v6530 [Hermanssonia centrifuga]|uniref:DUF6534 domain-containing protein n=1 Tax=Hermanssonia centrifuga TaxID=98765 RepID=A0A2R6P033_9APHY|nr:hypothetical protein PHLCEN_2v6530 [Hermanssonia centrifuga]